jgi:hypothetical protein
MPAIGAPPPAPPALPTAFRRSTGAVPVAAATRTSTFALLPCQPTVSTTTHARAGLPNPSSHFDQTAFTAA